MRPRELSRQIEALRSRVAEPTAEAGAAIAALLDRVPARSWRVVDQAGRADVWSAPWPAAARDVARIAALPDAASRLALIACHHDGRVREAAVRQLAVASDGREVPILLVRLNDWVEPVRAAASAALRARARPELAPVLKALPLLDETRRWERVRDRALLAELDAVVRAAPRVLEAGLDAADRDVRRACAARLESPSDAALERMLASDDVPLRRVAARHLASAGDARIARLVDDPLASIRRVAAPPALERGLVDARALLADRDAEVRAIAQAHALAADLDVVAAYRELVDARAARRRGAAVLGLVETGGAELVDEVARFTDDPSPFVRLAAMRAVAGSAAAARLLARRLGDPVAKVRRVAATTIARRRLRPSVDDVWAAAESLAPGARDAAVAVLALRGDWASLPYLVRAAAAEPRAQRALGEWLCRQRYGFLAPTATEVAAIRQALGGAALEPPVRGALEAMIEARSRA